MLTQWHGPTEHHTLPLQIGCLTYPCITILLSKGRKSIEKRVRNKTLDAWEWKVWFMFKMPKRQPRILVAVCCYIVLEIYIIHFLSAMYIQQYKNQLSTQPTPPPENRPRPQRRRRLRWPRCLLWEHSAVEGTTVSGPGRNAPQANQSQLTQHPRG